MDFGEIADSADADVALVLRSYAAYARGDVEQAIAPLHPDVEWIEPEEFPNGGRRIGPVAVAEYLRASRAMWRELHSEPVPYRHGTDIVIVHRVHGELVDGSSHAAAVADVYTVHDDQVTRMHAYADPADAFAGDFKSFLRSVSDVDLEDDRTSSPARVVDLEAPE